jgi:uncharacterized protein (TIGR04255 family)
MNGQTHKPPVEVVFELWWQLKEVAKGVVIDPHYDLLVGRVYDRLDGYPVHEALPASTMLHQVAVYNVQHRFRRSANGWPLVQIGPGILTLNDTEKYDWEDFKARIPKVLKALLQAYPKGEFKVKRVLLRQVNAVEFNFEENDVFAFLRNKMEIGLSIPQSLFVDTGAGDKALAIDLRFVFPSSKPVGAVNLRFSQGQKEDGAEALIWETIVQAVDDDAPKTVTEIVKWLNLAHILIADWLSKLSSTELEGMLV